MPALDVCWIRPRADAAHLDACGRAAQPQVLSGVLGVVYRAISTYLVRKSGFTVAAGAKTGAITLIQRFGSALNLNIHLHMLFLDGAYTFDGPQPQFHRTPRPTSAELARLLHTIGKRVARRLERGGFLVHDPEHEHLDFEPAEALDQLIGASIHYRIAIGPDAWVKVVNDALTICQDTQHLIGTQVVDLTALPDSAGKGGQASMSSYLHSWHAKADNEPWLFIDTYYDKLTYTPDIGWQIYEMMLAQVSADIRQIKA